MRMNRHQKGIASLHGHEKLSLPESPVGKGKVHPPCAIRGMSPAAPLPSEGHSGVRQGLLEWGKRQTTSTRPGQ